MDSDLSIGDTSSKRYPFQRDLDTYFRDCMRCKPYADEDFVARLDQLSEDAMHACWREYRRFIPQELTISSPETKAFIDLMACELGYEPSWD